MIGKISKGKGFRGVLDYALNKEKGRIIGGNMAAKSAQGLAKEFGEIRKLRPNLKRSVMHAALSVKKEEALSDAQWNDVAQKYVRGMGFKNSQYLIVRHSDTEHDHIHIIANRVTLTGAVVSEGKDFARQETLMREIEKQYGLEQVISSEQSLRKAPTKGEIEQGLRTGQPSTRQQLQLLCDAAAKDCQSYTEYQARLEAVGVELVPVAQLGGAKLSGLSYRLDGVQMKGRDLGKGYTASGIQKRGITYEQDRDIAAVRSSIEREARRAFGTTDTVIDASQAPERRGIGRDAGAAGPGHGRTDGRDTADAQRDTEPEREAGSELQQTVVGGNSPAQESHAASPRDSGSNGRSQPGHDLEADRGSDAHSPAFERPSERLVALSGTRSRGAKPDQRESGGRASEASTDRTFEALTRQIDAFGVGGFVVGVFDRQARKMMNRVWPRAELEASVAWLKRMNARGNDIFIRPAGDHGLVLVDDLKLEAIERMRRDGLQPAAVLETSPNNYQAWVKFSDDSLSADVRKALARSLAKQYDGDSGSADAHHYGRLAGFTNRKSKYERNGRQPFVLLHESSGEIAQRGQIAIQHAEAALDKAAAQQERESRLQAIQNAPGRHNSRDPMSEYQAQAKLLLERYGADADFSKLDWMIACSMSRKGYGASQVASAIEQCSPHVESRKAGHIEDYAQRTATNAAQHVASEAKQLRAQQTEDFAKKLAPYTRPKAKGRDDDYGVSR